MYKNDIEAFAGAWILPSGKAKTHEKRAFINDK